jgi:hypothetical protein
MAKYLVTWKAVNARQPENQEARIKQAMAHTELVREALKSGALKEWGCSPDGQKGYAVFEGSEDDMSLMSTMYVPFYEFDVYPILTVDQWLGVLKRV